MEFFLKKSFRRITILLCVLVGISGCNFIPQFETKFHYIPSEYSNLLTDYAKSQILLSAHGNLKIMTSIIFIDSSMLPISEISFDDGLEMSIQAFHRNKFTFDSISTKTQYSKKNIGIISYSVLGSISDERYLCMESGDSIDHLTIRSIPESIVIKGEDFLTVSLNDVKSFSYELNHSEIISFVNNGDYEEGAFSFVLLERSDKVYLMTFSNPKSKDFNFLEYLKVKKDK